MNIPKRNEVALDLKAEALWCAAQTHDYDGVAIVYIQDGKPVRFMHSKGMGRSLLMAALSWACERMHNKSRRAHRPIEKRSHHPMFLEALTGAVDELTSR